MKVVQKYRRFKVLMLGLLCTVVFSFSADAQKVESKAFALMLEGLLSDTVPVVSVQELAKLKPALVLDARTREEFEVSHMKNAIWVGNEDFDMGRVPKINTLGPIVVYCSIGLRSQDVTAQLLKAGYPEVYNLYGGIFEWVNQNGKVYDENGLTKKIHPYNWAWSLWLNEGEKSYE